MGASCDTFGTARVQACLRQIFATLNMYPINRPQVMISNFAEKFDASCNLTDEGAKAKIKKLIDALVGGLSGCTAAAARNNDISARNQERLVPVG